MRVKSWLIRVGWLIATPLHCAGRMGLKLRRYSHVVVRLKEIDFEAALKACTNRFQRARWEQRRKLADDVRRARSDEAGGGQAA